MSCQRGHREAGLFPVHSPEHGGLQGVGGGRSRPTSPALWGTSAITQPERALASAPATSHTLSTLGWLSALGLGCLFCIETPATETAAQPITVTAAESSRQGG